MTEAAVEIEILLFGATADAVGARRLRRSVSIEMNASNLLAQLKIEFPGIATHNLLLSINQEYANGDETIRDGDEVAIFTAVSGG